MKLGVSLVSIVDSYATDPDIPDHSVMESLNDDSITATEPCNSNKPKCDDSSMSNQNRGRSNL